MISPLIQHRMISTYIMQSELKTFQTMHISYILSSFKCVSVLFIIKRLSFGPQGCLFKTTVPPAIDEP